MSKNNGEGDFHIIMPKVEYLQLDYISKRICNYVPCWSLEGDVVGLIDSVLSQTAAGSCYPCDRRRDREHCYV